MHVAITGASSGIGAALARAFAARGAKLTLIARRANLLAALAQDCSPAPCHCVTMDLAVPENATSWIQEAESVQGPIDILINNAGIQIVGPTATVDPERGEHLLRLNVFTPLRLTRAVLPGMLQRKSGTIVDIASMASLAPTPGMTYYNASKGALAGASEALRGELRGSGVHVVTVYPGIISETAMGKKGLASYKSSPLLALQPHGTTAELAYRVARAVEKRKPRVIYPAPNALARWFPTITRWLMDRFTPPLAEAH